MRRLIPIIMPLLIASVSFSQERPDALKLYREGKYAEAVQVCLDELKELPRNMDSYTVMGWSLLALGRYQEAYEQARGALEIEPYDQRILEVAGEALYYLGKNRDALRYFEQYVSIAPAGKHISNVYYYMGEIYIRLGEYNNADIAISTALHYDDKDARWWSRLGYAREMKKDLQWAREAYENALKLNPNLVEARRGLESVQKKMSGG
jgi:tetratricopeptide (TPR) repeat protein